MKYTSSLKCRLLSGALALCIAGVATAKNIVEKLAGRPEFSTLVTAVTEAGLADALATTEDITVFAPGNDAFARLPDGALESLLADKTALTNLLLYHVSPGATRLAHFEQGPRDTLLDGQPVDISVKKYFSGRYRSVKVDKSKIVKANIRASNGIIHRINKVLDPEYAKEPTILEIAAGNPDFSILAGLVQDGGFARALGNEHRNLTVFAPTNAAFKALGEETLAAVADDRKLLRSILKNHIARRSLDSTALAEAGSVRTLLGRTLKVGPNSSSATGLGVDGKPIDAADISASNGIVHVVGEVLVPAPPKSLVDIAAERDELSTFVTAVTAAGLAETFDSTSRRPSYTIFAPNNEAFASLPDGALESLLADPTGALADVLKLHVVKGTFAAAKLYDGQILHALNGERLKVAVGGEGITINGSQVAEANLRAENGVLHVMNSVISSTPFTIADFVASKPYLSTLLAALDAAQLVDAVADPEADLTVLAPLNHAFKRLPKGTLDDLLKDPSGDLKQILLYHVINGSQSAKELKKNRTATTFQGADVKITSRKIRFWGWRLPYSIIKVNGIHIISADIPTDNGIIHLLSGVLLPPSEK